MKFNKLVNASLAAFLLVTSSFASQELVRGNFAEDLTKFRVSIEAQQDTKKKVSIESVLYHLKDLLKKGKKLKYKGKICWVC